MGYGILRQVRSKKNINCGSAEIIPRNECRGYTGIKLK